MVICGLVLGAVSVVVSDIFGIPEWIAVVGRAANTGERGVLPSVQTAVGMQYAFAKSRNSYFETQVQGFPDCALVHDDVKRKGCSTALLQITAEFRMSVSLPVS